MPLTDRRLSGPFGQREPSKKHINLADSSSGVEAMRGVYQSIRMAEVRRSIS